MQRYGLLAKLPNVWAIIFQKSAFWVVSEWESSALSVKRKDMVYHWAESPTRTQPRLMSLGKRNSVFFAACKVGGSKLAK